MKKYITIAALLSAGAVFANAETPTTVNGSITLDGTLTEDARLDFTYSTIAAQKVTTTVDYVTIASTDGYGLNTENASVTFDIQYNLNATSDIKFANGTGFKMYVETDLNANELADFNAGEFVDRMVVTTDYFANIASGSIFQNIKIGNISGLTDAGLIYGLYSNSSWTYYSASDITFSGNYATVATGAEALELEKGSLYTVAKITAASGASVKGIGFVASIPEPSAFGMLAGLGALALVAARRRRK